MYSDALLVKRQPADLKNKAAAFLGALLTGGRIANFSVLSYTLGKWRAYLCSLHCDGLES
jgi:hypothetical protein